MMWRKSTYSNPNGECIEVDEWKKSTFCSSGGCLEWQKSSYSGYNGNCVEVAGGILVRDSQLGDGSPVLRFTPQAWERFTEALKA